MSPGFGAAKARISLRRPDGRDLFWSLLIALLFFLSPTTSRHTWLAVLLSVSVGLVVSIVRLCMPPPRAREEPVRIRLGATGWLALGVVALAFAPTAVWLYGHFTVSIWHNAHGLFVPLLVFLLARWRLRGDPHPEREEHSAWGFGFLAGGLLLLVLDAGARTGFMAAVGLVLALPGLSLLLLGPRRTRRLAGALALAVFLVPLPDSKGDPLLLTEGTSILAEPIVHAVGIPATRVRTVFTTRNTPIIVGENCSGRSTFHAALGLACFLSLCGRGWRGRLLPLLVIHPATLALNAIRLVAILWGCDRFGPQFLDTLLHGLSGLFVLWGTLVITFASADLRGVREAIE